MATDPELRKYLRRLRLKRRLEGPGPGPGLDTKPRVHPPTVLQKIFKQRNQERSTYYFTTGRNVAPRDPDAPDEDEKPFWTPPPEHFSAFVAYQKQKTRQLRQKEQALPVQEKVSARGRLTANLLQRLHVPDDPPPPEKTIVDMDPEFYTIVEGRPNRDRVSVREYIGNIRDLVRVRLKIGYNEDECMLVDEQFRLEKLRLDKILSQHKQYEEVFQQFLANDHATSMELLKKADQAARLSAEKAAEIKVWIRNLGLIRTQVYMLEEKWRSARTFQKFLYMVSPMSWRREHDYVNGIIAEDDKESDVKSASAKTSVTVAETLGDTVSGHASGATERRSSGLTQASSATQDLDKAASLQEIIDMFNEETRAGRKPELYFTDPEELVKVFRSLAAQSLASLMHIEQLRLPLEALQHGVAQAKQRVEEELNVLREQVQDLEKEIQWEENRVQELRAHANAAIAATYQDIMAGESNILALHVWVEDVYQRCISTNDSHLTACAMLRAVEREVANELLALDYLDQDHVKRARKQIYLEERQQMKNAQDAQRKLMHMQQLVYRMERTLEPPPPRRRHLLVFRSQPPEPKKPPPPAPPELSEEERDRITFFTEIEPADALTRHFPRGGFFAGTPLGKGELLLQRGSRVSAGGAGSVHGSHLSDQSVGLAVPVPAFVRAEQGHSHLSMIAASGS